MVPQIKYHFLRLLVQRRGQVIAQALLHSLPRAVPPDAQSNYCDVIAPEACNVLELLFKRLQSQVHYLCAAISRFSLASYTHDMQHESEH